MPDRTRATISVIAGCATMFLVVQLGVPWLTPTFGPTPASVVGATAMILVGFLLERWLFRRSANEAVVALGFGRPRWRALLVAGVITALMLTFFPIFAALTGAAIRVRPDWVWILLGAAALNGVAEEVLFRGFTFGELRRSGYSFLRAGWISLVIFAAVHLLIFFQAPPLVASLATLVAIAVAFPMAYLFERGGNTIYAPALLHVGTHAFRLVSIDDAHLMAALTSWLGLQVLMPSVVFAFRRVLSAEPAPAAGSGSAAQP